jgi:ABC-type antimicrobial peptide transport system permease subunit
MSSFRFIVRSLLFHWRINLSVVMGVAAATAVLTGALLVGDSVRGSLRHLTLDRLGRIDEVLVTDRFFRSQLADELSRGERFAENFASATPAILFPSGTVEKPEQDRRTRASGVLIVGCDEAFWALGQPQARPDPLPGDGQIVLNAPLAEDLGAEVGDRVVLRLAKVNQIPADSPLGKKSDRIRSLAQLEVVDIIPAESLGRFSLRPSQSLPRNAYVSINSVQRALEQSGQVNAILVAGESAARPPSEEASQALAEMLRPTLADYGFAIQHIRSTFQGPEDESERVIFDYFSVTTDRMLFEPAAETAAQHAFAPYDAQPALTYLANSIHKVADSEGNSAKLGIPYSTITAIDSSPGIGPLLSAGGKPIELSDDEIVLNSWAAEDQQAAVGDTIRVTYFEPETTHGETVERSADFKLKAIVPLTKPAKPYGRRNAAQFDKPPTLVNDPHLTPEVPGITDQESIANWDAPFPFDYGRIRGQDDDYWNYYRTTPKAFISLATGQRLWGSRFGQVSSFRVPVKVGLTAEPLENALIDQIRRDRAQLGFQFIPVKRQQLAASSGTTPFDVLFLSLSMFIIAAALMLVTLLFRLGIDQRAGEVGILLAVGLRQRLTGLLLVAEGAAVAAIGGAIGVAAGIGYAWLMLVGLRTWWVGAVTTPFLELYATPLSLGIGYASGVIVSVLTIAWSIRLKRRISVRRLLAGQATQPTSRLVRKRRPVAKLLVASLLIVAIALAVVAARSGGEQQAGAFVGSGASVLTALLMFVWVRFQTSGSAAAAATGSLILGKLAARNAGRNPSRSTMTIGLMATASFLIVAMSSFRLAPTDEGTGGFDMLAESAEPIFANLNSQTGRDDLLADKAAVLQDSKVYSLRLKPGDDASCRNLYQSSQPRVLGITPALVNHFDNPGVQRFAWSESAADSDQEKANPWRLLGAETPAGGDAVPVVIDKNTAMYSLHLYKGVGEVFSVRYDDQPSVRFRVVGLLSNSILQGGLMVGEADFVKLFPQIGGYRYFLIQSPPGEADQVAQVLEDKLGDQGFDAVSSNHLLAELLAVQNTYLSTFQSLGALGLLLGTFGLATVQLRSVLERRGELALLRAAGFRRSRLAQMVMLENAVLLFGGLATGIFAALLAVLPHMLIGGATVPLRDLIFMLAIVLLVGFTSSFVAVRATLKAPLLSALRGE